MMREATFIEDWLEDKLEEGLQQGSQKTRLVDVLRILGWRFGALPITLEERLARLTAEQLDPLVNQALDAPTLEAFVAAIG
jgi:hypothetical protein